MTVLTWSFIIACNHQADSDQKADSVQVDSVIIATPDSFLLWDVDAENLLLKRDPRADTNIAGADIVLNGLNQKYQGVILEKITIRNDTLFTQVRDGNYLGEQMGSAGASAWIADAVINLTSVPGINYLSIKVDQHSHISPGTWSRKDLPDYRVQQ